MRLVLPALALFAVLEGCDALKPDVGTLYATTSEPVERPRCDACHGFPPNTGAHRYHLDPDSMMSKHPISGYGTNNSSTTRQITCGDCHAASIAFVPHLIHDTIFKLDTTTLPDTAIPPPEFHTTGWPWRPFPRPGLESVFFIDTTTLDSVPMAWASRELGQTNPFWLTKAAPGPGLPGHANGSVDVVFSERNANWTNFQDGTVHRARWNPLRLSCAAVACHGQAMDTIKYVWKQPVRYVPNFYTGTPK